MDLMVRRLCAILTNPGDGIVAMVDNILASCSDARVEVELQEGTLSVYFLNCCAQLRLSIPKSVLRAIIARVAALCHEQTPNSVSPYGGEGELMVPAKPGSFIKAVFVNTTDQQHLTLTTLKTAVEVPSGQDVVSEESSVGHGILVPLRS